ncbi:MAG: GTP-binding protein [Candidatus Liptonbacteria bacterium]|nr:GTP-binding protein [Candidatus Liptonbacteria bacterium]
MANSENKNFPPKADPPRAEKPRPPVVVVMGHVDHGKTTLLDYIRKANVAEREAGGITQAVGAYEIEHRTSNSEQSQKITFIDTPGHEAFVAMRSRGAAIADLAILVVAGDEGVKPQTKEVIGILQKSETPFVVAITKVDKPGANVEKIKSELAEAGVLLEGYGGQVSWHGVSAKTGEGVNDLLDLILLTAEVEELSYDPALSASGFVLEVRKDKRRGLEATVIVKDGTLRRGDMIATSSAAGKVKILEDFLGKSAVALEASAPARIIGFSAKGGSASGGEGVPLVGEEFRTGAEQFAQSDKAAVPRLARAGREMDSNKDEHVLRVMLKAGDAGSLEALAVVIRGIDAKEMTVEVVNESVGDITDGDVKEAIATNAAIVGFKVKLERGAANLADAQHIRVVTSNIVYDLLEAVEEFVRSAGKPLIVGVLEVLASFNKEKLNEQLVGGKVTEGIFRNKGICEVVRVENGMDKIVASGKVMNLRDKKADAAQAEKGKEAGVLVDAPVEIMKGDRLVLREKR